LKRAVPVIFAALVFAAPITAAGNGLVGVARIPADARDSLGETLGGFGSGMALVPGSWLARGNQFVATLAMLPDRGWNTAGTTDYRARLEYFDLVLSPNDGAPGTQTGLKLTFRKSLLLHDPQGQVTTGLDPTDFRPAVNDLPDLPVAANGHVSLDDESVAFAPDGSFWIGEEYGPYIYHYDAGGKMIGAIRPPEALIPHRAGRENFSAGENVKGEPQSGRQNNQGMEGMSIAPGGKLLFAVTQSALIQDLDPAHSRSSRRNVRLLEYDISGSPKLLHEYVVQLPLYNTGKRQAVAAQSEMLALNEHQLLLLCRDSGAGFIAKRDASVYRMVNLVDISGAGDIAGRYDGVHEAIAPGGVLRPGIRPARLIPFLNMNDNAQLSRFGLHNGAPNNAEDLYEKWESMALAPGGNFLLIGSDNDFITQHGMMAGKPYADASGADVDTLVLAYRLSPQWEPAIR